MDCESPRRARLELKLCWTGLQTVLCGAAHVRKQNCPAPVPVIVGVLNATFFVALPRFVTVSVSTFVPLATVPNANGFGAKITFVSEKNHWASVLQFPVNLNCRGL
jgi:hypothetical protein